MDAFDHCVLVTGGTGKLGRIFVSGFLRLGRQVAFTSRSAENAAALVESLGVDCVAGQLHSIRVDLTEAAAAKQIAHSLASFGLRPTCLINNTRNLGYLGVDAEGVPPRSHWLGQYLLDVVVPYELSRALLGMDGSRLRDVINIGSMYGIVATNPRLYEVPSQQSPIHYGIAKAALVHLTKEMAVRFAPRGVRVNAVSYGGVEGRVSPEFKVRYGQLCPAGRMLGENEVMGPVEFLASTRASGMTGHNLVVDGGWSVW